MAGLFWVTLLRLSGQEFVLKWKSYHPCHTYFRRFLFVLLCGGRAEFIYFNP